MKEALHETGHTFGLVDEKVERRSADYRAAGVFRSLIDCPASATWLAVPCNVRALLTGEGNTRCLLDFVRDGVGDVWKLLGRRVLEVKYLHCVRAAA